MTIVRFLALCLLVLSNVGWAGAAENVDPALTQVAAEVSQRLEGADAIEAHARDGRVSELLAALDPAVSLSPTLGPGGSIQNLVATVRRAERAIDAARGSASPSLSGLLRAESEVHAVASRGSIPEARLLDRPLTADQRTAATVDVEAIIQAGADVTAAIDRLLPSLLDAPPAPSSAGTPCEVADHPPYLCIGGTGADAHSSAYRVIIDEGGNDTYALRYADRFLTSDPVGVNPVQVVIDLGGDDAYQGAGYGFGGVGVTVDVAGNDRYREAIYRYQQQEADPAHSYGTGFGALGLGALVDLQGADEYALTGRSTGGEVQIFGQGAALDGVGILVDRGTEADTWSVTAERPAPQTQNDAGAQTGIGAQAYASAANVHGASLLFDEGGDAQFSVHVTTPAGSTASAQTQGYAARGNTFLLSGAGDTSYRVDMVGGNKARVYPWAQGFGNTVLRDAGGDDTYAVTAMVEGEVVGTAEEGCACGDLAVGNPNNPFALGGWANAQAVSGAVLYDAEGDDSYTLTSRQEYSARAVDRRGGSHAAAARANSPYLTTAAAQGVGGHLVDGGGNDTYSMELATEAIAHAVGGARNEAIAHGGILQLVGQGSTGGSLVDAGGRNTFRAVTRSDATATPTSHLAYGGITDLRARGMREGVFVDGGSQSTYVTEPNVGALAGSYETSSGPGAGSAWSTPFMLVSQRIDASEATAPLVYDPRELGAGTSQGLVTKRATAVQLLHDGQYQVAPGRNEVALRLTEASGAPIADTRVLLEVQAIAGCLPPDVPVPPSAPCPYLDDAEKATRHTPLFQMAAVTDGQGVATVDFDMSLFDRDIRNGYAPFSSFTQYPRPNELTLVALYSGDAERTYAFDTLDLRTTS